MAILKHPTRGIAEVEGKHVVVRMFSWLDRHRDFSLAHEIIREADIVGVVHLQHDVVEASRHPSDTKGHGMLAVITMHEGDRGCVLAHADFVLDPALHAEQRVEAIRSRNVALSDNAMP